MLFVVRPDPNEIAGQARNFALQEVQRSAQTLLQDRGQVEYFQSMHFGDEDQAADWQAESELNRAETRLEAAQSRHDANLVKLNWENDRRWSLRFKPERKMFLPWVDATQDWLAIFRPRRVTPA